jgi:hypothetical protein
MKVLKKAIMKKKMVLGHATWPTSKAMLLPPPTKKRLFKIIGIELMKPISPTQKMYNVHATKDKFQFEPKGFLIF